MGPDELDDLLESIRAEGKTESALALYEGTRETDLVDEEIDDRVLRLLGLEDVFDIDYGTYLTLLKEKLAEARMGSSKISTEEDELILSEFKRVKGKVGRFKIKPQKISADIIRTTGPIRVDRSKFLLADKVKAIDTDQKQTVADPKSFSIVSKTLDNIIDILQKQESERKKALEKDRKRGERESRKRKESLLEKSLGLIKGATQKILAPVQSIWDKIVNFLQNVVLGFVATKLFDWLTDPKNKNKVEAIGRFLKDWWPALLGLFVTFATPFGAFIRGTIGMLRVLLPRLVNLIRLNPNTSLITAAAIGGAVKIQESERMKPLVQQQQADISKTLESKDAPWYQKLGASFAGQSLNAPGGPANPMGLPMPGAGYANGGQIKKRSFFGGGPIQREVDVNDIAFTGGGGISEDSGVRVTGAGPDTQLIAAQPGEVVMSKKAVDRYGANFFLGLNKKSGGTNIPKMVNNIQLAQGGGVIQKTIRTYQGGGMVGGLSGMAQSGMGLLRGLVPKPNVPITNTPRPNTSSQTPASFGFVNQLDEFARKTAGDIGGRVGEREGRRRTGNLPILGDVGGSLGRREGTRRGEEIYENVRNIFTPFNQNNNSSRIKTEIINPSVPSSGSQNIIKSIMPIMPILQEQSYNARPINSNTTIEQIIKIASTSPNVNIPGPSNKRISFVKLPPQIEKVAMNRPTSSPAGTGVPALSAEDPNFAYSASRAFYQGITNTPVA